MTLPRRTIGAAVLCLGGMVGCGTAGGRCDLAAHKWKQTSPSGCTESGWTFTPTSDGAWTVNESGCAWASGTATYDGKTVTADIEFVGRTARYEWPLDAQCRGTTGKVTGTDGRKGPPVGESGPSTLSIVP